MRLTNRNARMDKDGRHNDRNYNVDSSSYIDQSRSSGNKYVTYLGQNHNYSFLDLEQNFYEQHFDEYINQFNSKKSQISHPKRKITVSDYYKKKFSRPEDKILQIGNMDSHIDSDELWDCAQEYMAQFNEKYGEHCMILDMALHVDEATPHVHIRRVWIAEDENGVEYVNQGKALEQLGFERPDLEQEDNRFNNAKMSFTKEDSQMFIDICKARGIYIDEPREYGTQQNLSIQEFKNAKERIKDTYTKEIEELKQIKEQSSSIVDVSQRMAERIALQLMQMKLISDEEMEELKEKKLVARLDALNEKMYSIQKDMSVVESENGNYSDLIAYRKLSAEKNKTDRRVDIMENYIRDNGLEEDYFEYEKKELQKDIDKNNQSK